MTTSPTNTAGDLVTDAEALTFTYTNWRGETDVRFVDVAGAYFHFGATEWHGEPQWLLRAHDRVKAAFRDFAVKDIVFAASSAHATGAAMREAWADAYKAFVGAFDTAVGRRKQNSDYAQDARARMRAFNDMMLAALSSPAPEGEAAQGVEPVAGATEHFDFAAHSRIVELARQLAVATGQLQNREGEIAMLLNELRALEQLSGWSLEDEDADLVFQIEAAHKERAALRASSSAEEEKAAPPSVKQEEAGRG